MDGTRDGEAGPHRDGQAADTTRERIVEAGLRLFSALGFDATEMQLIADTAGVTLREVKEHFASRTELYREVMRLADLAEQEAMAETVAGFRPTRQSMERLLDTYLDFYAARPDLVGLWLHRRTGDAADAADLDPMYSAPKVALMAAMVKDHVRDPATLDYTLWSFPWIVSGFLGHGLVHTDGRIEYRGDDTVTGPDLEAFRSYLHHLARMLFTFPEAR